jgi:hypothetical protein
MKITTARKMADAVILYMGEVVGAMVPIEEVTDKDRAKWRREIADKLLEIADAEGT